jgi:hypothetical protein
VASVYSPPGAVASFLIEPLNRDVRHYGEGKWTWADYRLSVGHAKHIGLEKVVCKDCHAKGYDQPGVGACGRVGCHVQQAAHTHGAADADERSGCATCHSFQPGKDLPKCMDCHRDAQKRREDGASIRAVVDGHAKADCGKCHDPHQAKPTSSSGDCSGCHAQKAPRHAAHPNSRGCQDCHSAHAPAATAKGSCPTCHARPEAPRPAGHASCLTCHEAHASRPTDANVCDRCHASTSALRAKTVKEHATCTNCHEAHAPKAVTAASSCQKCHWKIVLGHAKPSAAGLLAATGGPRSVNDCTACHVAHPKDEEQKVVACTSCHAAIGKDDKGAHASSLACSSCHANHAFKAPSKSAYAPLCAKCHDAETKKAAGNKGHASCGSCHGASTHREATPPGCASCHATEASSAPKGHAQCGSCHETHGGALLAKSACATCHADRDKGPHAAVKGGCSTCHRAHGPNGVAAPPTCTSCHASSSLGGLHSLKGHAECLKCHSSHAAPRATRESCAQAGCHVERKSHQPDSKRCVACHVFK